MIMRHDHAGMADTERESILTVKLVRGDLARMRLRLLRKLELYDCILARQDMN